MKSIIVFVCFALAIVAIAAESNETTTTDKPIKTVPTSTTTTPVPTTTTITPAPITTTTTSAPTTTTTAPAPTNTTATPTTTTTVTTTHSTTTNATTPTANASTTTMAPPSTTTKPVNNTISVYVRDQNNTKVCILLKTTAMLTFNYKVNNTAQTHSVYIPQDVRSSGSCVVPQHVTLGFNAADSLMFVFGKDSKDTKFIESMNLTFTMDLSFPGITNKTEVKASAGGQFYKYSSDTPYMCKSQVNNTLPGSDLDLTVTVSTTELEFDAFRTKNNTEFGTNYVACSQDVKTSNIVPIAVGAALAALVVIVLIAYLISRNRTKRGYESV